MIMPDKYYITPVPEDDGDVDPGYGVEGPSKPPVRPGRPSPPIHLPGLPGIWPKPGGPPQVTPPIHLGPPSVQPPIYIPEEPGHPLPKPPGTIWPPLPPDLGIEGKVAILIWVIGVGTRWLIVDAPSVGGGPIVPPSAGPK